MQISLFSLISTIVDNFLAILKIINNDYSQITLVLIAVISLWFVYHEFISKRRPFTFPTLLSSKNGDDWYFQFILTNKGNMPAMTKVTKALLKIGDEEFPTNFNNEIILAPNEKEFIVNVGHINKFGRNKIIGHEYLINRVEIIFNLESKFISDRRYKYNTEVTYEVNVKGESPIFTVISQKFT